MEQLSPDGQFPSQNFGTEGEPLVIHTRAKEEKKQPTPEQIEAHNEALAFVEQNRDLYEHYGRGKAHYKAAPPGLDTFAYDLITDDIYISTRFYKEEFNFSDEATSFAVLHETEHMFEKKRLLAEKGGERIFAEYLKRKEKSKAFGVMDNCIADIRENRAVVSKTHAGFQDIEQQVYKESLFKETDFTKQPKHIQLPQALLREARVPGEQCTVAPEVREKIEQLRAIQGANGANLMDVMTNPNTPMSARLKLQDKYIWPMVQELLEKDLEEDKKNDKKQKKGDDSGDGQKGDGNETKQEKDTQKPGKEQKGKPTSAKSKQDPNKVFADDYKEADKKTMNAVPIEQEKKAFKKWKEEGGSSALERADKEYAEKLGVSKEELQNYRQIVESLSEITNPETGATAIEELRSMFSRIISERLKPAPHPKYPLEEGEDLVDPAALVAEAKSGNLEPKVWETFETKERKGKKFGEVEITLVFDRSTSMAEKDAVKLKEQQRTGVLAMEALKEFADLCDEERINMDKPLEIRSESYSFQSDSSDAIPIKKMSKELGEKERIEVASRLGSASGSTTDFVPLETIYQGMTPELKEKIKDGEVKKIVIVFTDGGSDDKPRVEKALGKLKSAGVIAIGVGITEDGAPALTIYAPDARLAETAEKLPVVLTDILKEHLNTI